MSELADVAKAYLARTKERDEWKATAETQAARAEEFRVKCETAYREGYKAGQRRLSAIITERAADAGRAVLRTAPVLASNPLDTRTPDYHQLVEDLSEAVREMLRQKGRADRAEQGAREADAARRIVDVSGARIREERNAAEAKAEQMRERALKAETKWHEMSALRTCADLNHGKALVERDEAKVETNQALALSRRDNARALEAEREVESLTARLEQMRGRAEEAEAEVRRLRTHVADGGVDL